MLAAQHSPPVQQLSSCHTVGPVVFSVRSLAQIKMNHCPQQNFSLIINGRLIGVTNGSFPFHSSNKSPDEGTDVHPAPEGCVLWSVCL